MANRYFVGNNTNWNSTGSWASSSGGSSGQTVPVAGDDVFLDGNSPGTLNITAAAVCRSLTCTGFTKTLAHNAFSLTIGTSTAAPSNAAMVMVAGMTYTPISGASLLFTSTVASTVQTVDFGGQTTRTLTFNAATTSGYQLVNNGITGAASVVGVTLVSGSLDTNSLPVTCGTLICTGSTTRSFLFGTSTITLQSTGTVWGPNSGANVTMTGSNSTFLVTDTSSSVKTFAGDGFTYGTVHVYGASGAGAFSLGGANVITNFICEAGSLIQFSAAMTLTNIQINGTGALPVVWNSSTTGTQRSITITNQPAIPITYLTIQDISVVTTTIDDTRGGVDNGDNSPTTIIFPDVTIYNVAGTYHWTCPPGVTSATINLWGGGGGGGGVASSSIGEGEGGGGGAFSQKTNQLLTPGTQYAIIIGAGGAGGAVSGASGGTGGDTSFNGVGNALAKGGTGGQGNNVGTTAGTGGASGSGVGTTKTSGGNGGTGGGSDGNGGGGGGGSGGLSGNGGTGGNPSGATGGSAGSAGTGTPGGALGGTGGSGSGSGTAGNPGAAPGAGGGGGGSTGSNNQLGGNGAAGQVTIIANIMGRDISDSENSPGAAANQAPLRAAVI